MCSEERATGRTSRCLNLTTRGLTLLGVLLSGVTVAFGVGAQWWLRALPGAAVTALLVVGVKVETASGQGPVAQLANWVIGEPTPRPPDHR